MRDIGPTDDTLLQDSIQTGARTEGHALKPNREERLAQARKVRADY